MLLYYIRHAQSTNNALFNETGARIGRVADPDLSNLGGQQARLLAAYCIKHQKEFDFTHIYSSLMVRALQTAYPLAEAYHLPLNGQIDLHESGGVYLESETNGELHGQPGGTRIELMNAYPGINLPVEMNSHGWWDKPYETPEDRPIRAQRVLEWLIKTHPGKDERVVFLSHHGFFNHFFWSIMRIDRPQGSWLTINNTGITCFEIGKKDGTSVYINRLDHLSLEMITE